MYERFTDRARRVMQDAKTEADSRRHNKITAEHVLLGLLHSDGSAWSILRDLEDQPNRILSSLIEAMPDGIESQGHSSKAVIESAMQEAKSLGHNYVGSEHLLLGILRLPLVPSNYAGLVLQGHGVTAEKAWASIERLLGRKVVNEKHGTIDQAKKALLDRYSTASAGRYVAKFCGVQHEGVFEIVEGMAHGQIVRMPFSDGDHAEETAPTIARLVNSQDAINKCLQLYQALGVFLDDGDGSDTGVHQLQRAAAVINAMDLLRDSIEQE